MHRMEAALVADSSPLPPSASPAEHSPQILEEGTTLSPWMRHPSCHV